MTHLALVIIFLGGGLLLSVTSGIVIGVRASRRRRQQRTWLRSSLVRMAIMTCGFVLFMGAWTQVYFPVGARQEVQRAPLRTYELVRSGPLIVGFRVYPIPGTERQGPNRGWSSTEAQMEARDIYLPALTFFGITGAIAACTLIGLVMFAKADGAPIRSGNPTP